MRPDPTDHLGLVHHWAAMFCRCRPDDFDDVVQMGTLGLLRACELYDAGRGVQFSTFASLLIKQAMIRELKKTQPLIRVPEQWTIDQRIPVRSLNRRVHAGDDEDGTELGDLLPDAAAPVPGDRADADQRRDRVRAALAHLPRRDRQVLELRYGIRADGGAGQPLTLAEVGALLRVTRERVRQIEVRAAARLARRLAG